MLFSYFCTMNTSTSTGGQPYVAHLIFRILCDGVSTEQYEEQWRLVFADDAEEALVMARIAGQEEVTTFTDRWGRLICWQMVAVKDLQPLELKNGALVFSQIREVPLIASPVWSVEEEETETTLKNEQAG